MRWGPGNTQTGGVPLEEGGGVMGADRLLQSMTSTFLGWEQWGASGLIILV